MSDFEKFKEQLSSKKKFNSSLTGKKMFLMFGINLKRKMKDYHDLYLKCDILLLPDVFEKFRNTSLKNYGLCPSDHLSAPALSWDAMLNMTKVERGLIPDPDMHIFFEKGMRDGVSYISN